jgi:hypothetical protein
MSHHAHGTRRIHAGASRTREADSAPQSQRFSYRDLHPEMYRPGVPSLRNRRISDDERRAAIIADLRANGPSTAVEIVKRLRINKKYITPLLNAGINGVTVVRTEQRRSTLVKVWGVTQRGISE